MAVAALENKVTENFLLKSRRKEEIQPNKTSAIKGLYTRRISDIVMREKEEGGREGDIEREGGGEGGERGGEVRMLCNNRLLYLPDRNHSCSTERDQKSPSEWVGIKVSIGGILSLV